MPIRLSFAYILQIVTTFGPRLVTANEDEEDPSFFPSQLLLIFPVTFTWKQITLTAYMST